MRCVKLKQLLGIRMAIIVLWALALIAIVIAMGPDRVISSYKSLTPQEIRDAMAAFGALAVLAFLAISLIRPLMFLPVSPFTLASGFAFGMWPGLLWSFTGTVLSAVFIFFLSRYLLHDFVTNRLKGRYPSFDRMLEGRDWSFIVFLRMIPVLPFDLVSGFAGVSHVKFRDFLIGTVIGEAPGTIVLVMLGSSLDNIGSAFFYLSLALAALVFAGSEVARRWINKRRKAQMQ